MAGVSTKEIKSRIRSMESTRQITKAMEMVAASKLRRAQERIESARPYFAILSHTIDEIVAANREFTSPYLVKRGEGKVLYVVIAGDRGLAGGYNSNLLRQVVSEIAGREVVVLPIGKKAVDYFRSHNVPIYTADYAEAAAISVSECFTAAKQLCCSYKNGEFQQVHIAFTDFNSILSQMPRTMQLLPLRRQENTPPNRQVTLYEPDSETVFEAIVPEYLGGVIYGALCESRASEQAARRMAMDSATKNADEMIADLSLKYNRARQAAITQEITEIVAGARRS